MQGSCGAHSDGSKDGTSEAAAAAAGGAAAAPACSTLAAAGDPTFTLVREEIVHERYVTLYNRVVQFPPHEGQAEGAVHEFDVAGHPRAAFRYAVAFPFHTADDSVTLVREYAQGLNAMAWCLPTGAFDPRKHADIEACARAELSEEARLAGGVWLPLQPAEHPGTPEIKWCRNRFHAYIVVDPVPDERPGARDSEEYIQVCRVPLAELRGLMLGGEMLLPSIATCFWAMERIAEMRRQGTLPASAMQR